MCEAIPPPPGFTHDAMWQAEQSWLLSCELLNCGLQPRLSLAFPQTEAGVQSSVLNLITTILFTPLPHTNRSRLKGLLLLKEISETQRSMVADLTRNCNLS